MSSLCLCDIVKVRPTGDRTGTSAVAAEAR